MNTTNRFVKKLELEFIILDLTRFPSISVCILILVFFVSEK
jgi:hypothetical protein